MIQVIKCLWCTHALLTHNNSDSKVEVNYEVHSKAEIILPSRKTFWGLVNCWGFTVSWESPIQGVWNVAQEPVCPGTPGGPCGQTGKLMSCGDKLKFYSRLHIARASIIQNARPFCIDRKQAGASWGLPGRERGDGPPEGKLEESTMCLHLGYLGVCMDIYIY